MKAFGRDKLRAFSYALIHPFDGFYEIRFRGQGSLPLALVIMALYGVLRCIQYQYTGFVMNYNSIEEMDSLSIFISTVTVILLFSVSNWTVTTLFNGKGKLGDILTVVCYSLSVLLIGDGIVTLMSNFITIEEIMILETVRILAIVWFAFLLVAGLGTIHEYSLGGNIASIFMSVVAAAVILFIGILLFTMVERMISFLSSVFEEMMRRI